MTAGYHGFCKYQVCTYATGILTSTANLNRQTSASCSSSHYDMHFAAQESGLWVAKGYFYGFLRCRNKGAVHSCYSAVVAGTVYIFPVPFSCISIVAYAINTSVVFFTDSVN